MLTRAFEHEPECEPNTLGDFLQVIFVESQMLIANISLALIWLMDGILTVDNEFYQVFPVVRYRVLQ